VFPRRGIEVFRSVLGDSDDVMVIDPVILVQPRFDLRPISSTPKFLYRRETPEFRLANNSSESVPAQPRIDEGVQFAIGNVKRQSRRGLPGRYVIRIDEEPHFRLDGGGHEAPPFVGLHPA
jgi:hypothetical protein